MNAKSTFDFGANTPAGEYLGSFIKTVLSSPDHFIEYGGFETITSKGSSSQCCGDINVFSQAQKNYARSSKKDMIYELLLELQKQGAIKLSYNAHPLSDYVCKKANSSI